MPSSYFLFCDPATGQTLRSDGTGADYGVVSGNCTAILGGIPSGSPSNLNCADVSVIVSGVSNCLCIPPSTGACLNFIGNGNFNIITACNSFIGSGNNNCISSGLGTTIFGSSIVGGQNNTICDNGTITAGTSFIGGGNDNSIFGAKSAVVAGVHNCANGRSSFIGGGECNRVWLDYDMNAIVGGCQNNIGNSFTAGTGLAPGYSFIGGGNTNCIDSTPTHPTSYNTIGGGVTNKICGDSDYSSIFGGRENIVACNEASIIAGGKCNHINQAAHCSFIGGGYQNCIDSSTGTPSFYGVIGGGAQNVIKPGSDHSSIFSGKSHIIDGASSFIGSGENNCICSTSSTGPVNHSVIGGGTKNIIGDNLSTPASCSFIGGGECNFSYGTYGAVMGGKLNAAIGSFSVVGGGCGNAPNGDFTAAFSGFGNLILSGYSHSVTAGGCANQMGSSYSFIGSGSCNFVAANTGHVSSFNSITGGCCNTIAARLGALGECHSVFNVIGGGAFNCIDTGTTAHTDACFSIIGGGEQNTICAGALYSSIFSGKSHTAEAQFSFIGGGDTNKINNGANWSFIGGGCQNGIAITGSAGSIFGVIGGGYQNCINATAMTASSYGVIGGGQANTIAAGANHSSIFSGNGNTVSGNCSAVLGGDSNNDNGNPWTGIYGTAVAGLALTQGLGGFFVNELVIQNVPVVTALTFGSLQPGEVYTTGAAGSGFVGRPLYIA